MNLFHPIISDQEFGLFQNLIYREAGIQMSSAKKALVTSRLAKRLKQYGLVSYGDYFQLLFSEPGELQITVDLLTTNETYFFREPKHFEFLEKQVIPQWKGGGHRIWSAASSSGEEAFSLAMTLAEHAPSQDWEVIGTDLSTRMVERAKGGQYPLERAEKIPLPLLRKYCLKGIGKQTGSFMVMPELRKQVKFHHANLLDDLSHLGKFDLIFLRNVLIYFDIETKRKVVARLSRNLKPGGMLLVGHSETLNGVSNEFRPVAPSIYVQQP